MDEISQQMWRIRPHRQLAYARSMECCKTPQKEEKGRINDPVKLQSIGIKRLVERALWAQGIRTVLEKGKKRHEFQTDHGFRKWYKTQCEMSGMKPINIEKLMGHSLGMSDSYYRATADEILEDYLRAWSKLTLSNLEFLEVFFQCFCINRPTRFPYFPL